MKLASSFAALALCALISGCGADEKISEIQQTYNNMEALAEAGEKMNEAQQRSEQRREERRKRGDTLAIPYQDLQKYLPESVAGYTAEEPEGQSFTMTGYSYSTASRRFTNEQGEEVRVELFDYNSAYDMLAASVALWQAGFSMEDAHGIQRTFDAGIEHTGAFEEYNKDSKRAKVTYALGDRFLLMVEADNKPDTEFVKSVASSMKLGELAAR